MNKLEQYRDKTNIWKTPEARGGYELGFDAAIALELPVKFLKWERYKYGLLDIPNQSQEKQMKCVKLRDKIYDFFGHYPSEKELYQYWINNVYKPE